MESGWGRSELTVGAGKPRSPGQAVLVMHGGHDAVLQVLAGPGAGAEGPTGSCQGKSRAPGPGAQQQAGNHCPGRCGGENAAAGRVQVQRRGRCPQRRGHCVRDSASSWAPPTLPLPAVVGPRPSLPACGPAHSLAPPTRARKAVASNIPGFAFYGGNLVHRAVKPLPSCTALKKKKH